MSIHDENDDICQSICICSSLERIKKAQEEVKHCKLINNESKFDTIPFILQTPYGHPFFTFGNLGKKDCFITVFFKVVKIDVKNCCAILELLEPNKSILDCDTGSVELEKLCEVDYVTETKECITIELKCYNALKCLEPSFVKK